MWNTIYITLEKENANMKVSCILKCHPCKKCAMHCYETWLDLANWPGTWGLGLISHKLGALAWFHISKTWTCNWPSQTWATCWVNSKPGWPDIIGLDPTFFLYFFQMKPKNIKLIYEYFALYIFLIAYIHIECFLTFRRGIYIHIYSPLPHELFLNFFMWDIKTSNIFF